jgi:hypothetical protein
MLSRTLALSLALLMSVSVAPAKAEAQTGGVYRVMTVQATPGELLQLIELYREEQAMLAAAGQAPPLMVRHSQGDFWDLMLVFPIPGVSEYVAESAVARRAAAKSPGGRTGAELSAAIDALTAWREELFVRGPTHADFLAASADAGFFHIEMFLGLAGKRTELIHQREMENEYLVALGRRPNQIFTRIAGAGTDAFTIGYYRDLKQYANPPQTTPEQQEKAAVDAGFEGANFIGSYLRELLLRHHDTLAVAVR